jgi:hypothetical protein
MNPERESWLHEHALTAAGCVDWPWATDGPGYAVAWHDGRMVRVSQIVLVMSGRPRPAPPHHHALHSCDRPLCVSAEHLRWGTNAENGREAYARGLHRLTGVAVLHGESVGHARLTEVAVHAIRDAYAAGGVTQRDLAARFGVSQPTVGKVIHRRTWRHI